MTHSKLDIRFFLIPKSIKRLVFDCVLLNRFIRYQRFVSNDNLMRGAEYAKPRLPNTFDGSFLVYRYTRE